MAKKAKAAVESESEVIFAEPEPEPEPVAAPTRAAPPAASSDPGFSTSSEPAPEPPLEPDTGGGEPFHLVLEGGKHKIMKFDDEMPVDAPTRAKAPSGGDSGSGASLPLTPPRDYGSSLREMPPRSRGPDVDVRRAVDELGRPDSSLASEGTNLRPWRRTLYRSNAGSEVRRYESSYGTSTILTTRREGDLVREERFHSRLVEPIISDDEPAPVTTVVETVTTETKPVETAPTPTLAEAPKKKRGLFGFLRGKHKPGQDSGDSFKPAMPVIVETVTVPATTTTTTTTTRTTEVPLSLPEEPTKASAYYDYAGDDHEVIDLEGVGPEYAERLQKEGVYTTSRLCYEDAAGLASRIDVPEKTVRTWQAMAQLMKINGVGKQYAEAMARAGITGIEELKERRSTSIAEQVTRYLQGLESTVVGQSVTATRVGNWKRAAAKMRKVRQAIPSTTQPEKVLARGHIPVLKQRHTKALGPPRKARGKKS